MLSILLLSALGIGLSAFVIDDLLEDDDASSTTEDNIDNNDVLSIGSNQTVYGGAGDDRLTMSYGEANSEIHGGEGNDTIRARDSTAFGGLGDDSISGFGTGSISGEAGQDTLSG